MSTPVFDTTKHPRAGKGKFTAVQQGAPQIELTLAGPSKVIRGQGVGYSVTESHMSREFVNVEDREQVADRLAAEHRAEFEAETPGSGNDCPAAKPDYWMRQFEAYDIFEAEAPAEYSDTQRQGFESVSLAKLNLDLDHQSFHTNLRTVANNERLARDVDGRYRQGNNPEQQAVLDEFWGARADRLTAVREQLEELNAR